MVFIELTPFIAFRLAHWADDELRELQNYLLENPDAGDVIRGSSGLRKLLGLHMGVANAVELGSFITTT